MTDSQPNNPLHGLTLERILTELVERHGWEGLALRIPVRCFEFEPSIKSSLSSCAAPWAREKVEGLYLRDLRVVVAELAAPLAGPRVAVVGADRPA